jgi:hypothetical protein
MPEERTTPDLEEIWRETWAEGSIGRFTTYTDIDEARAAAERLAQERG